MTNETIKKRKGFTLVETLVYAAIFGIMISFVIVSLYQTIDSGKGNAGRVEVENETDFIMRKISWAFSGAAAIIEPSAGASSSRLSLDKYNYPQNPIVFDVASGTARISRGGSPAAPLNSSNVSITDLTFTRFPVSGGQPEGVEIALSMIVSSTANAPRSSTSVETTLYLRK